jgi:chromosome segregation ATPase
MRSVEPAFDPLGEFCPALPDNLYSDVHSLENTIAKQSSELNARLTEILELYNVQARQADKLEAAREEIDHLKQKLSALQAAAMQQSSAVAAAREKISSFENNKVLLERQLREALEREKILEGRLQALQTAFDARATNVASALEQIGYLNSELGTAAAERFKLVAAVHSEKRRHNQQTSIWEDKSKRTLAKIETQEMQIKYLEAVRGKLDKRIEVLEALLKSEPEVAGRKIKRLSEELEGCRSKLALSNSSGQASQT